MRANHAADKRLYFSNHVKRRFSHNAAHMMLLTFRIASARLLIFERMPRTIRFSFWLAAKAASLYSSHLVISSVYF